MTIKELILQYPIAAVAVLVTIMFIIGTIAGIWRKK